MLYYGNYNMYNHPILTPMNAPELWESTRESYNALK